MAFDKTIDNFADTVQEKKLLSDEDISKMKYGMQVTLNEAIKTLIILLFFITIGRLNDFILAFLILATIRSYAGGIHFYTWTSCFLFSSTFFMLSIIVLPNMPAINNTLFYYIITIYSILMTLLFAPKTSKHRPITQKKYIYKAKWTALIMTLAWLLILFTIFKYSQMFSRGIWTVTLLNFQLMISGGLNNEKKIKIT